MEALGTVVTIALQIKGVCDDASDTKKLLKSVGRRMELLQRVLDRILLDCSHSKEDEDGVVAKIVCSLLTTLKQTRTTIKKAQRMCTLVYMCRAGSIRESLEGSMRELQFTLATLEVGRNRGELLRRELRKLQDGFEQARREAKDMSEDERRQRRAVVQASASSSPAVGVSTLALGQLGAAGARVTHETRSDALRQEAVALRAEMAELQEEYRAAKESVARDKIAAEKAEMEHIVRALELSMAEATSAAAAADAPDLPEWAICLFSGGVMMDPVILDGEMCSCTVDRESALAWMKYKHTCPVCGGAFRSPRLVTNAPLGHAIEDEVERIRLASAAARTAAAEEEARRIVAAEEEARRTEEARVEELCHARLEEAEARLVRLRAAAEEAERRAAAAEKRAAEAEAKARAEEERRVAEEEGEAKARHAANARMRGKGSVFEGRCLICNPFPKGFDPSRLDSVPSSISSKVRRLAAATTVEEAGRALEGLRVAARDSAEARVDIARAGGIPLVVSAMGRHTSSAPVQEQACAALCNLANNDANQVAVAAADGILAVVSAMRRHMSSAPIQEKACMVLRNLAWDNDANRVAIAAAEGIPAVVSAMGRHKSSAPIQEQACAVLCNLAKDDANEVAIGEAGGIADIVSAMRQHSTSAGVLKYACWALRNLSDSASNLTLMREQGARELLEDAQRCFPLLFGEHVSVVLRELN